MGCLLLSSCAQVGVLQGGKKDETPPKIDSLISTPNNRTNVNSASFQLAFNEWIKLDDPINKTTISPPLKYRPKIDLKGRTVKFSFDEKEILKKDVTYHINFGESIKDLTEGNVAEKPDFIFATGPKIDTISAQFRVVDAVTGGFLEKIKVEMYDNLEDTAFTKELPLYFAYTDKNGLCTIKNIREGKYHIFALDDKNQNYQFDLPTESIAFFDSAFQVQKNIEKPIFIKLTKERPKTKVINRTFVHDGLIKINFNQEPTKLAIQSLPQKQFYTFSKKDSTLIYYNPDNEAWKIVINAENQLDTIDIKRIEKKNLPAPKFQLLEKSLPFPTTIQPYEPIKLTFNLPIASFNKDSIILYADTTKSVKLPIEIKIDSLNANHLNIQYDFGDSKLYLLQVAPNAVKSYYGTTFDTVFIQKYNSLDKKTFSDLIVFIDSLNPNYNYIVQFLNSNKDILNQTYHENTSKAINSYHGLKIEPYFIKIIEDVNKNGIWDPANYKDKTQSEYIFLKNIEDLKANFVIDKKIQFFKQDFVEEKVEVGKRLNIKN